MSEKQPITNRLRAAFPKESYGKLYKSFNKEQARTAAKAMCHECGSYHSTAPGIHLDYVGHAAVTDRLLEVDPEWNWEPMSLTPDGQPCFVRAQAGNPIGLWIKLTINGTTRLGFGSVEPGAFDAEKQLIGDAIRNAAMRFGVALDLWSKHELESAIAAGEDRRAPASPPAASVNRTTGEIHAPQPRPPAAPAPQPRPAPPQEMNDQAQALVESVDVSTLPRVLEDADGNPIVWGLPIQAKVWAEWEKWNRYDIYEGEAKKSTNSVLRDHTWGSASDGQRQGRRERALRWRVGNALDGLKRGKLGRNGFPFLSDQRSARCLFELLVKQGAQTPSQAEAEEDLLANTNPEADGSEGSVPF